MTDFMSSFNREVIAPDSSLSETRKRKRKPTKDCAPGCDCARCGLASHVRPRYYAGQLLSEADLRDEQAYQIAKTRLHNRYLHGYGVVCGLEVTCEACDDRSVTIRPGYALGPCGEDIIVPCAETIDVIAAIEACRRRDTDCDPIVSRPRDIDRTEEHWCITLAYDELQVTPKAVLRNDRSEGCGCGESTKGCEGGHKGSRACGDDCDCAPVPTRVYEPGKGLACEPTRVRETYRIGVVDRDCTSCDTSLRQSEFAKAGKELGSALGVTTKQVGTANAMALMMYALVPYEQLPSKYQDPNTVTTTLTRSKRGIWDLYAENPLDVACPDLKTVKAVEILDPPQQGTMFSDVPQASQEWQATQQAAALDLGTLFVRYLWEYVCRKLLVPCPPEPCDDRIVIGCVTVRDGRVDHVCNFSCRRRAGSFVARDYWLSLFGIKPLILGLVERLCCGSLIKANSPIRNQLAEMLQLLDPGGEVRRTIAKDDFLRVRRIAKDFASVRDRVDVTRVAAVMRDVIAPGGPTDFVADLDQPVTDVERKLREAGRTPTVEDVDELPLLAGLRAAAIGADDDVVLLRDRATGRLAGVERAGTERVEALSQEVAELRAALAELRQQADPDAASTRSKKPPTARKPRRNPPAERGDES